METIAGIFAVIFVSIILLCLAWTLLDYVFDTKFGPKNELEKNLKEFDKKNKININKFSVIEIYSAIIILCIGILIVCVLSF